MTHRFFGCPSAGLTLPSSDPRQTSWGRDVNLKLTNQNEFLQSARLSDALTWTEQKHDITFVVILCARARLVLLSREVTDPSGGRTERPPVQWSSLRPLVPPRSMPGLVCATSSLSETTFRFLQRGCPTFYVDTNPFNIGWGEPQKENLWCDHIDPISSPQTRFDTLQCKEARQSLGDVGGKS